MTRDEFLSAMRAFPCGNPLSLDETPAEWFAAAWEIESVREEQTADMAREVRKVGNLDYTPAFLGLLARSLSSARLIELYVALRDRSGREREFRDKFERAFPAVVADLPAPLDGVIMRTKPDPALDEWHGFECGDSVCAPDRPGAAIEQAEVLWRVASGFKRVIIDWTEGDRWVERRIAKAEEIGYGGFLLEAEHALKGCSVLVSVADAAGSGAVWLRFYMTPDTGGLELNYQPASAVSAGRVLAVKLAELLGYEFTPWEEDRKAEPGAVAAD